MKAQFQGKDRVIAQGLPSLKIDIYPNQKVLAVDIGSYADGTLTADALYLLSQNRFKPAVSLPKSVSNRLG